ncbi:MAG TPA: phage Gp37/Gp68 family protein [Candidatus Bathyarchaeia archaeon]|nr:phage Gp37/Gp68 family protein [Candidatus Bathyarchaeia archaeon]
MSKTKIEWTDMTWNPTTGCSKVSAGCKNCYAERMAKRLQAMGNPRYVNGFEPQEHPEAFDLPFTWKRPKKVFVNSMSDLFHEAISEQFIEKVFDVMNKTPMHTYQILTKRPERAARLANQFTWTDNIWVGTSVENSCVVNRIDVLRQVPSRVRFLSCEPLLGPLENVNLQDIHWVIAGGESGPGARPMDASWVRLLLHQCQVAKIPFFFKQWGGVMKHRNGRLLDGREWNEFPE